MDQRLKSFELILVFLSLYWVSPTERSPNFIGLKAIDKGFIDAAAAQFGDSNIARK